MSVTSPLPLPAGINAHQFLKRKIYQLIHTVTSHLKSTGACKIKHILLPFRPQYDQTLLGELIVRLFPNGRLIREQRVCALIIGDYDSYTLVSLLKYIWSRLPDAEVIGWEAYYSFRRAESEREYSRDAFIALMPNCLTSAAHASIVYDFMDLLVSTAAHSKRNQMNGHKIAKMFAIWAFNSPEPERVDLRYLRAVSAETLSDTVTFTKGIRAWLPATSAMFHLMLSFLRSMLPADLLGLRLPQALTLLLTSHTYPPPCSRTEDRALAQKATTVIVPVLTVQTTLASRSPRELMEKVVETIQILSQKDSIKYEFLYSIFKYKTVDEIVLQLSPGSRRIWDLVDKVTLSSLPNALLGLYTGWAEEPINTDTQALSITEILALAVNDYEIWIWLSAMSLEANPATRGVFGRSLVLEFLRPDLETVSWVVIEEKVLETPQFQILAKRVREREMVMLKRLQKPEFKPAVPEKDLTQIGLPRGSSRSKGSLLPLPDVIGSRLSMAALLNKASWDTLSVSHPPEAPQHPLLTKPTLNFLEDQSSAVSFDGESLGISSEFDDLPVEAVAMAERQLVLDSDTFLDTGTDQEIETALAVVIERDEVVVPKREVTRAKSIQLTASMDEVYDNYHLIMASLQQASPEAVYALAPPVAEVLPTPPELPQPLAPVDLVHGTFDGISVDLSSIEVEPESSRNSSRRHPTGHFSDSKRFLCATDVSVNASLERLIYERVLNRDASIVPPRSNARAARDPSAEASAINTPSAAVTQVARAETPDMETAPRLPVVVPVTPSAKADPVEAPPVTILAPIASAPYTQARDLGPPSSANSADLSPRLALVPARTPSQLQTTQVALVAPLTPSKRLSLPEPNLSPTPRTLRSRRRSVVSPMTLRASSPSRMGAVLQDHAVFEETTGRKWPKIPRESILEVESPESSPVVSAYGATPVADRRSPCSAGGDAGSEEGDDFLDDYMNASPEAGTAISLTPVTLTASPSLMEMHPDTVGSLERIPLGGPADNSEPKLLDPPMTQGTKYPDPSRALAEADGPPGVYLSLLPTAPLEPEMQTAITSKASTAPPPRLLLESPPARSLAMASAVSVTGQEIMCPPPLPPKTQTPSHKASPSRKPPPGSARTMANSKVAALRLQFEKEGALDPVRPLAKREKSFSAFTPPGSVVVRESARSSLLATLTLPETPDSLLEVNGAILDGSSLDPPQEEPTLAHPKALISQSQGMVSPPATPEFPLGDTPRSPVALTPKVASLHSARRKPPVYDDEAEMSLVDDLASGEDGQSAGGGESAPSARLLSSRNARARRVNTPELSGPPPHPGVHGFYTDAHGVPPGVHGFSPGVSGHPHTWAQGHPVPLSLPFPLLPQVYYPPGVQMFSPGMPFPLPPGGQMYYLPPGYGGYQAPIPAGYVMPHPSGHSMPHPTGHSMPHPAVHHGPAGSSTALSPGGTLLRELSPMPPFGSYAAPQAQPGLANPPVHFGGLFNPNGGHAYYPLEVPPMSTAPRYPQPHRPQQPRRMEGGARPPGASGRPPKLSQGYPTKVTQGMPSRTEKKTNLRSAITNGEFGV